MLSRDAAQPYAATALCPGSAHVHARPPLGRPPPRATSPPTMDSLPYTIVSRWRGRSLRMYNPQSSRAGVGVASCGKKKPTVIQLYSKQAKAKHGCMHLFDHHPPPTLLLRSFVFASCFRLHVRGCNPRNDSAHPLSWLVHRCPLTAGSCTSSWPAC